MTGQKPCLAGTYVAEQTSKTACELISVTAPKSPSSTKKLGQRDERRRRRRDESNLDKDGTLACTVLPALSTIDPLLLRTSEGFFQPGTFRNRKKRPKDQAADKLPDINEASSSREEGIRRMVCRLHKGVRQSGSSPTGDDFMDQTDAEAMSELTRPKTGTKLHQELMRSAALPAQSESSSKSNTFNLTNRSGSGFTPRSGSSKKKKRHANHYDLFAAVSDDNSRMSSTMSCSRHNWIANGKKIRDEIKSDLMVTTISILPENAVEDFFKEEERVLSEKAAEKKKKSAKSRIGFAASLGNVLKKNKELLDAGSSRGLAPAQLQPEVEAALEKKMTVMQEWSELLDAVMPQKKIDKVRRQACESLRMFVFGVVGNENETLAKEKEKIFYESCGERDKVVKLWKVWTQLDDDHSGRVDISEFRAYAEKVGKKKMGEKAMGALLGKKSSFSLEDMMCLIWPCAQTNDVAKMKQWIKDYVASMRRVATPPILGQSEYEGLIENFRFFDADGSGYVSVEELVSSGLLDKEQAQRYLDEWDDEGCGEFSEIAFCHMLCPTGYRAYAGAQIATDKDGNQVVYEDLFGWRLKNHIPPTTV